MAVLAFVLALLAMGVALSRRSARAPVGEGDPLRQWALGAALVVLVLVVWITQ